MISDNQMYDQTMRRLLSGYARAGIPDDASVLSAIHARLSARTPVQQPGRIWYRPRRWAWVVAVAIVSILASAGTAFAVSSETRSFIIAASSETRSIIIHWIPAPVSAPLSSPPQSMRPFSRPFKTTLADAQQRAGFTALTIVGDERAKLQRVVYAPNVGNAPGSILLDYTVATEKIQVSEWLDPKGGATPLEMYLKQFPPDFKPRTQPKIEKIDGAEYFTLRSTDGAKLLTIYWKTPTGIVVHLNPGDFETGNNFSDGLNMSTVLTVISHLK